MLVDEQMPRNHQTFLIKFCLNLQAAVPWTAGDKLSTYSLYLLET